MNDSENWQEETYREVYEEELRGLQRRKENDKDCTIETIEGLLRHLYINEGNNWEGRGLRADIVTSATIAAHEAFISAWKAELTQKG